MGPLLIAALLLITAVVIGAVVRQGMTRTQSDLSDLGQRYASETQRWASESTVPSAVTRVYLSEAMRDADSQLMAGIGYRPSGPTADLLASRPTTVGHHLGSRTVANEHPRLKGRFVPARLG